MPRFVLENEVLDIFPAQDTTARGQAGVRKEGTLQVLLYNCHWIEESSDMKGKPHSSTQGPIPKQQSNFFTCFQMVLCFPSSVLQNILFSSHGISKR